MHRLGQEIRSAPVEGMVRRLGDALSEGVIGTRAGRIVWATTRVADWAGEPDTAALLGLPFDTLFEDAGQGLPVADPDALVECRLRRAQGPELRVAVRCLVEADDAGPDLVWMLRDVSRARLVESELLRASRELHAANREVAVLRERLRREVADREELLTVVSHELRTPVTVILGFARLLLSGRVGALGEEQQRFLGEIRKGSERLDAFIGNLLEAAHFLSGDTALEVSERSVEATLESVASMLKPLVDERGIALRIASGDGLRARFDPVRIEQVLTNLVGNAIKFAPAGSTIDLLARPVPIGQGRFVEIEVADCGPGVSDEDRERIFEPYVRGSDSHGAGGLGLGLAIARRLVEAHGGDLRCLPREGGGSRFVFTLPSAEGL